LRPETASATGASDKAQVLNAAAKPAPDALKADPQRITGNAALARRAVGPG
jgi:cyclic-di-GMP phosphodiesterase TipF (flagellum assembly factor)